MNGTKQLVEVTFHTYPRPIPSPVLSLRPARAICESCHTPAKFVGEKLLVRTYFADDETNTKTQSIVLLHLGGRDSVSRLSGIHGVHLGHIEYVATDNERSTIPWVEKHNADGTVETYVDSKTKSHAGWRTSHDGLHRLPQPRSARNANGRRGTEPPMEENVSVRNCPLFTKKDWYC